MKALYFLLFPYFLFAAIQAGIGKADITPPVGTPSAGYPSRRGAGMEGVRDPLLAISLFLDTGEKKIALCSVDHLGFTHEMVQEVVSQVHEELQDCEVYIASSHTHSGSGAFLNVPFVGEMLAGRYDPEIVQFTVRQTAKAIIDSSRATASAKVGVGYGKAAPLSTYRSTWPKGASPLRDVAVIKVTRMDDTPLAVLFNFPVHPTVLPSQNRLFSADFVGSARNHIQKRLGNVQPIYFNGAQGDINPVLSDPENPCDSCGSLGSSLAETVEAIWRKTKTSDSLHIETEKLPYSFAPKANPSGLVPPVEKYETEMNLLVLDRTHAFVAIPGELSCFYDRRLKEIGAELGYEHVSIFGLLNDAHGYIILPESWRAKTYESNLSFGGENYGEETVERAARLLESAAHQNLLNAEKKAL